MNFLSTTLFNFSNVQNQEAADENHPSHDFHAFPAVNRGPEWSLPQLRSIPL
jgi:hypothetical protein